MNRIIVILLILAGALIVPGQQFRSWFYYGEANLASPKSIAVEDLVGCMLGESESPPNRGFFKRTLDGGIDTNPGMLRRKMCDVALILNHTLDEEKSMIDSFPGFTIFKISGASLEVIVDPSDQVFVAVGSMRFATQQTLAKRDLKACGATGIRRRFGPSPNIWKEGFSDWNSPIESIKKENLPIDYTATDVWVMRLADYKIFSRRFGTKYPVFDVSPDSNDLTRRK